MLVDPDRITQEIQGGFPDLWNRKGLADWLVQKREQDDLSQDALAERVGCKKAQISKIETQRVNPSLEFLSKLSHKLGVSLAEPLTAMGYLKPEPHPEPHLLRLIHYYKTLPAKEQKLAEELIKTLWRERGEKNEAEKPRKRRPA